MPQDWITAITFNHIDNTSNKENFDLNKLNLEEKIMSERFRRALFNQPNFQDIPSNLLNSLWKQNQTSALTLFFVKMESARKTSGQLFNIFHGGIGSRQNWTANFP